MFICLFMFLIFSFFKVIKKTIVLFLHRQLIIKKESQIIFRFLKFFVAFLDLIPLPPPFAHTPSTPALTTSFLCSFLFIIYKRNKKLYTFWLYLKKKTIKKNIIFIEKKQQEKYLMLYSFFILFSMYIYIYVRITIYIYYYCFLIKI